MPASADLWLVRETQALIASIEARTGLPYADPIGGCSPLSVSVIARRLGGDIIEGDLGTAAHELGVPGYFGPPVIVVNRSSRGPMRWLAYAHGLAHLAAGELEPEEDGQIRFMSDIYDWTTVSERRADLFSLANSLDDPRMDLLRSTGLPRWEGHVRAALRELAPDWPADRVRDRAKLRLLLYERRER